MKKFSLSLLAIVLMCVLIVSCSKQLIEEPQTKQSLKELAGSSSTNRTGGTGHRGTTEEAQAHADLINGYISFKNSLVPFYQQSSSYEDFKAVLLGDANHILSREADDLLHGTYEVIHEGVTDEFIIENYSGKEMAQAALYLIDNNSVDNGELFFNYIPPVGNDNARVRECKWYQVGCHLSNVIDWFGDHKDALQAIAHAAQTIWNLIQAFTAIFG